MIINFQELVESRSVQSRELPCGTINTLFIKGRKQIQNILSTIIYNLARSHTKHRILILPSVGTLIMYSFSAGVKLLVKEFNVSFLDTILKPGPSTCKGNTLPWTQLWDTT